MAGSDKQIKWATELRDSAVETIREFIAYVEQAGGPASVIEAINAAHENDLRVVALTGRDGGMMGEMLRDGDVHICVPANRTARIQETHLLAIHCFCDGIDCLLLGVEE